MKNILFTALTILMLLFGALSINRCTKQAQDSSIAKIDTILQVRHDTLIKLDTILKNRVQIIKTAPETLIVKEFERVYYAPEETTKVVTTVGAERKALIVKDSLTWCMACRTVDSATIDSLEKQAKKKEPTDWQTLGLVGAGGLILGIILTR